LVTGTDSGVSLTWNETRWVVLIFKMQQIKISNLEKRFKKGSETIIELPIGDLYQSQIQGKS
jgi:predicted protein tyrosine phosphatase